MAGTSGKRPGGDVMPYIEPEALQEARRVNALSWLKENEPWNLIRLSINNYCTAEHDSLKLSNGKWYWFSKGIGGVSALDYLIKVKQHRKCEVRISFTNQ